MVDLFLPGPVNFRILCTVSQHHLIKVLELSIKATAEKKKKKVFCAYLDLDYILQQLRTDKNATVLTF